jgi:hypothetical protein
VAVSLIARKDELPPQRRNVAFRAAALVFKFSLRGQDRDARGGGALRVSTRRRRVFNSDDSAA